MTEEIQKDERCAECGEFPLHYRHTNTKHKRYHPYEPKVNEEMPNVRTS
jgi:hypothetical protein